VVPKPARPSARGVAIALLRATVSARARGPVPAPFTRSASRGHLGRAQHLNVSINAVLLPLHDPVRVAEEIATIDLMSGGRLSVVVGLGYRYDEFTMAGVELKLGELGLGRGYLEAAAREFADRFDLPALERAAGVALRLASREAFAGSPIHTLLEQSRARLRPLDSLFAARSLSALGPAQREELLAHVTVRTLGPEEMLVTEGEPSRNLFVVKSGLVGVWLEKPSGGGWLVRCCFPGWLLGESSVLGTDDPRCTASLRAERVSEVWILPAAHIRALMREDLAFAQRIAETKQVHRIDSFFSMHETMGQLDVQVRDEVLQCLQRLESFDEETVLLPANTIPAVACLVARGSVELYAPEGSDKPVGVVEPDSFYGVRDAIHQIAPKVMAIARPGTTVAFFDAVRLQQLCERSPEHVVAVLERLG